MSVDTCPEYSLRRTILADAEHSAEVDQIGGRTLAADVQHNIEKEQIGDRTSLADVEQGVVDLTVLHAQLSFPSVNDVKMLTILVVCPVVLGCRLCARAF